MKSNKRNLPCPMMIKLGFSVTIQKNLVESIYESMLVPQHSNMNFRIFNNMSWTIYALLGETLT